jgi:hypothetical protein
MGERGMSSYDKPLRRLYLFTQVDLTAGDTRRIRLPTAAGMNSGSPVRFVRITDLYMNVSHTAATVVTTAGIVQVGDGTTAGKFAAQKIGVDAGSTVAKGTTYGIQDVDGRVSNYKNRIDLLNDGATAGTLQTFLDVTFVAPTGGSPGGAGDVVLELEMW